MIAARQRKYINSLNIVRKAGADSAQFEILMGREVPAMEII
jgi:hypothetical protein